MILIACAVVIIGAMGWLTKEVMAAERERSLAEARADLQERIRLSLWRMDSVAAGLMIEENQRTGLVDNVLPENPLVKMRFKVKPDGKIDSNGADAAEVEKLRGLLSGWEMYDNRFDMMCAAVHVGANQWVANAAIEEPPQKAQVFKQSVGYQQDRNLKERQVRGGAFNNAVGKTGIGNEVSQMIPIPSAEPLLTAAGMFQPAWVEGEAFLLRDMRSSNGGAFAALEGAWLDTTEFRKVLLDEVADLLPHADVEAVLPGGDPSDVFALASFPWRLIPGESAIGSAELRGPLVTSLTAGWVAVAIALLAGAALVHGVMKLSERRASFVSAVTHELRTPLTTFRLYSEMLDTGAVSDESKRAGYFKTLRREADRLSHLVENVLAFSQVERGSARSAVSEYSVEDLVGGMRERFEERLAGAEMVLQTEWDDGLKIRADAAGVEHVLFNLIDNAAKYATSGKSNEVTLKADEVGDRVEIKVCDQGAGVAKGDRQRVFRAFHKSAKAAAESRPGVGLGLALSRRLARQMGGDLVCRGDQSGACFVLSLPKA
ncbi:sensor histidine kinase [Haloferula sp.]|uniref:sensor histidine kinase n=1 Tax=Haloferula sp. TaxID=2497595 RepID=UPI00329E3F30